MTLIEVYCCTDYIIENPPAGNVIKALAEAYVGGKKKKAKNNRQQQDSSDDYDDGSTPRPKRPKSFKDDKERLEWEERNQKWEENQLSALIQIFGGSGGVVRKGKKGGK